jgi:hypothetical protein
LVYEWRKDQRLDGHVEPRIDFKTTPAGELLLAPLRFGGRAALARAAAFYARALSRDNSITIGRRSTTSYL